MSQFLNEPDNTNAQIFKHYQECIETAQRLGAELAEIEDYLYDELGLDGDEIIDCLKQQQEYIVELLSEIEALKEYKWMYEGLLD